jgi:hypothetical protein
LSELTGPSQLTVVSHLQQGLDQIVRD